MLEPLSPLTQLRAALADGRANPASVAEQVITRANGNASRNTYLFLNADALRRQTETLAQSTERPPLWSVPISLKDCFDLASIPTSCGSPFYARQGAAARDSAIAARLHSTGALITGKTHLHPLAYGITGENADYGDCLQPRDPALLTGGSSSGAAASVQEGSALAAIGTDTGGSIRVPAALCGLTGYRASHRLPADVWPEAWQGGAHLAPSFDTLGFLLRDPRDAAPIAEALFGVPRCAAPEAPRIGCVPESYLAGCDPDALSGFAAWKHELAGAGAHLADFDSDQGDEPSWQPAEWDGAVEIFAGIQAHEASLLNAGHFDQFEPSIRDRLRWGSSLTESDLEALHLRWQTFRTGMARLLSRFDLLLMPCAPVSRLAAGADHSQVRPRILRYTSPFSLAGLPALSLPGELLGAPLGTGVQLAAAPGADALLLAYAEALGARIASRSSR